jgi:hypothetical protein
MCQRRDNQSMQPYFSTLLILSFVARIVLVAFITFCCFEEKSIWTNLTRQGFILFHVSHHVSVQTTFTDYFSSLGASCVVSIKSTLRHVVPNLCFCI